MILTEEQVIDILHYIGVTKIRPFNIAKQEIQFCCPIHCENTPSMGYSLEKDVCHCFTCHFTGTISWLIFKATDEFKSLDEVDQWIRDRYGVDINKLNSNIKNNLLRYEDIIEEVVTNKEKELKTLPKSYIAPFRSGIETYKYFFNRGFTKDTMKEFSIGRDLREKTVTVPIFLEDDKLLGVIGRKISKKTPKNERYKVYDFLRGEVLFPLNKINTKAKTLILVEGILDSVWLYQEGIQEIQFLGESVTIASILGNGITKQQVNWILSKSFDNIIDMFDDDNGGVKARKICRSRLGGNLHYYVVTYPKNRKDPQECTREELISMISNARPYFQKKIKKIY